MIETARGEIGYHEIAKILASKGYATNKPELDKGVDMIALDDDKVALIQIKTVIYDHKQMADPDRDKRITGSGIKNGSLKERYSGSNLIIVCLNSDLKRLYTITIPKDKLPDVQSIRVPKNPKKLGKYSKYLDNIENLSFSNMKS